MAFYYAWRGDLVYGIYRRMGGSRSRAEVSKLFGWALAGSLIFFKAP